MTGDGGQGVIDAVTPVDGRSKRFVQYLLVGLLGVSLNEGVLFATTGLVGLSYVVGGFLGRVVSILANYAMNDAWTWRERGERGAREWTVRGLKYVATRVVGIGIGLSALVLFVEVLGLHYLLANVLAIGVGVLWGFGASDRWVWPAEGTGSLLGRATSTDLLPWRGPRRTAATNGGRSPGTWVRDRVRGRLREYWATRRAGRYATRLGDRLAAVDRPTWYVVGLAAALFVAFSVYTVLLYHRFQLTGADFGSYIHMFETTLSGEGFLLQGKYRADHPSGVYWGAHFSLTLLLYLPLYALLPRPETLLVAKSFVLAASVPLLWAVARGPLGDRLAGLVVVSYAFNPFFWSAWSFDFQEQSLLPLFAFGAYYLYQRERYRGFLALLGLVLLTNEFTVPIVGGFLLGLGVRAARRGALRSEGRVVAAGLVLVAAAHLLASAVIGRFSTSSGIPTRVLAIPLQGVVSPPRASLGEVVVASALHPGLVVGALTTNWEPRVLFLLAFALPVLFLPATDESAVGALLPFVGFAWLLSSSPAYFRFAAHYPFYVIPFVYVGAVHVLTGWDVSLPSRRVFLRALVSLLLLNAAVLLVIDGGNTRPVPPENDRWDVVEGAFESVPASASLLTQNDLYPHVAARPDAHFVVSAYEFERFERQHGPIAPEYVVYSPSMGPHWSGILRESLGDRLGTEYGLYRYEDDVWVFRRGYDGPTRAITTDEAVPWFPDGTATLRPGSFIAPDAEVRGGYLHARADAPNQFLWYGPYAVFPAGTYNATFRVLAWAPGNGTVATVDVAAGDEHRVLGSATVNRSYGWQTVTVTFTLDRPRGFVEFRAYSATGDAEVLLDRVTVRPRDAEGGDVPGGVAA